MSGAPHIAGQSGIERFFRSWGGEALYNSHEENEVTGPILNKIGLPCIIEAKLPIRGIVTPWITSAFIGLYSISTQQNDEEPKDYEGALGVNLVPGNAINVIEFSDSRFLELTKHDNWQPPLK